MIYYLRYINILKDLRNDNASLDLLPVSALILHEIAVPEMQENPMTVSDVMELTKLASSATLHRKFSQMLNDEWVTTSFQNNNRRTKYIQLTMKSKSYYELKGKAMKKALRLASSRNTVKNFR